VFEKEQTYPDGQAVGPVQLTPPHCPYGVETVPEEVVVVVEVVLVEVVEVVLIWLVEDVVLAEDVNVEVIVEVVAGGTVAEPDISP
jgi:hypothetical protein